MDFNLKSKSETEGTCWIEFNISSTVDSYETLTENSRFVDEDAYNFYTDIFEENSTHYNYYGDTKFDKPQLIKIKLDIENRIKEIDKLNTLEDIIEFRKGKYHALDLLENLPKTYKNVKGEKNVLVNDIKKLGNSLLNLVDQCIKQEKVLWILGL